MFINKFCIIDQTLKELQNNLQLTHSQKQTLLLYLNNFGIEYTCISLNEHVNMYKIREDLGLTIEFIVDIHNFDNTILENILKYDYVNSLKFTIDIDSFLIKTFHEKTINNIISTLKFVKDKKPNIKIIIYIENCFQKNIDILSKIIFTIEDYIDLVCIVDTKGQTTHYNVENIICLLKNITFSLDIGSHFYNDSSSAVYNTFIALSKGCNHIITSILGLGKRNGITDLSGIIARIYSIYPESLNKYNLIILKQLNKFVSSILNIPIPRNNPIINDTITTDLYNSKIFIKEIYINLDNFLKLNLPNIYSNLEGEYVKILQNKLKYDALNNHILAELFDVDIEFTKTYILRHVN